MQCGADELRSLPRIISFKILSLFFEKSSFLKRDRDIFLPAKVLARQSET